MAAFLVKCKTDGGLEFNSDYQRINFNNFVKKNAGKLLRISLQDGPVSDQMRGYMFGAVIPFLRQIDANAWDSMTDEEVYEVLKKNFNYFTAINPISKKLEKYAKSTMSQSSSNKKAMEFIERIGNWVTENYQQTLPNPEEYKEWRDSGRLK